MVTPQSQFVRGIELRPRQRDDPRAFLHSLTDAIFPADRRLVDVAAAR